MTFQRVLQPVETTSGLRKGLSPSGRLNLTKGTFSTLLPSLVGVWDSREASLRFKPKKKTKTKKNRDPFCTLWLHEVELGADMLPYRQPLFRFSILKTAS